MDGERSDRAEFGPDLDRLGKVSVFIKAIDHTTQKFVADVRLEIEANEYYPDRVGAISKALKQKWPR